MGRVQHAPRLSIQGLRRRGENYLFIITFIRTVCPTTTSSRSLDWVPLPGQSKVRWLQHNCLTITSDIAEIRISCKHFTFNLSSTYSGSEFDRTAIQKYNTDCGGIWWCYISSKTPPQSSHFGVTSYTYKQAYCLSKSIV